MKLTRYQYRVDRDINLPPFTSITFMFNTSNDHIKELRQIIKQRANIDNKIKRYKELFPNKVEEYLEKYELSEDEVLHVMYISDYLLTGVEIVGYTDEERLDFLVEMVLVLKSDGGIPLVKQTTLIELVQQLILAINRHFSYQHQRGFPRDIIELQIIEYWLIPFFEMVEGYLNNADIRAVMALLMGLYHQEFPTQWYRKLSKDVNFKNIEVKYYYQAGWDIIERINFSDQIDTTEFISTTAFDVQTEGTEVILGIITENSTNVGSSFTNDNPPTDLIRQLSENLPQSITDWGDTRLRYYQTQIQKQKKSGERIFCLFETKGDATMCCLVISSKVEDINYSKLRNKLQQYIIDASQLEGQQLSSNLDLWARHILIVQTVQDAEPFKTEDDNIRNQNWEICTVGQGDMSETQENLSILVKLPTDFKMVDSLKDLIEFNSMLHKVVEKYNPLPIPFEITPIEAYFEDRGSENSNLMIFEVNNSDISIFHLQQLQTFAEGYIHRKKTIINKKYLKLKIKDLNRKKPDDFKSWILNSFNFRSLYEKYTSFTTSVNLRERFANQEVETEEIETSISVSDRLNALENKKNLQIELQQQIMEYIISHLIVRAKILLVDHNKLRNFFDEDRSHHLLRLRKEEESLLEEIPVRKLPHPIGQNIIDIVKTIDASLARDIREGVYKLQKLEKELTTMSPELLEEMLKILQ